MKKIRIGVSGVKEYSNKVKVKKSIFELNKFFEGHLIICTRGKKNGAEALARKYANEFDIECEDIKPFQKSIKAQFGSSKRLAQSIDSLFVFVNDKDDLPANLQTLIKETKKQNKKVVFKS